MWHIHSLNTDSCTVVKISTSLVYNYLNYKRKLSLGFVYVKTRNPRWLIKLTLRVPTAALPHSQPKWIHIVAEPAESVTSPLEELGTQPVSAPPLPSRAGRIRHCAAAWTKEPIAVPGTQPVSAPHRSGSAPDGAACRVQEPLWLPLFGREVAYALGSS